MTATRKMRRILEQENAKWPDALTEIPKSTWPVPPYVGFMAPVRVYRSRRFLVQVYDEPAGLRLSASRIDLQADGDWKGGISWDDLFRLKSEAGFGDRLAVEVYPRERDLVNVANMRHLWILPEDAQMGWRSGIRSSGR